MRDHQGITLDQFNGLFKRGKPETTPIDHFTDCNNIQYFGEGGFQTRDGVDILQSVQVPLRNILRIYNYVTQDRNTLLVLTEGGDIYHVINGGTVFGPILHIAGMTDFGYGAYNGRAFITPFISRVSFTGQVIETGMQNQFVYVYKGDGTTARLAAGNPPPIPKFNSVVSPTAGFTDPGLHAFAVLFETDTGYLTAPGGYGIQFVADNNVVTVADKAVDFSAIPTGGPEVVARRLVATAVIPAYNGDPLGYQFFEIPGGRIPDNITTTWSASFFDADLVTDASHLLDNFSKIPAGVGISFYHGRLCLHATFEDISIIYVSAAGEPEAINQTDGFLIVPLDGNPITNTQELRDVLYAFKRNRTVAYVDNGGVPSTWPFTIVDQAVGCPVHGVATVIDTGSASVDFLVTTSYRGVELFNGKYMDPELSWKIKNFWLDLDKTGFRNIQILNDPIKEMIYIVLPDFTILMGDYNNGLDSKRIRWTPWSFDFKVNTIALVDINTLILGSSRRLFT